MNTLLQETLVNLVELTMKSKHMLEMDLKISLIKGRIGNFWHDKKRLSDLFTDLSLNGGHLLAAGVLAALLGSINLVLLALFRRIRSFSKSTRKTLAMPVLIFFSSFSV